MLVVDILDPAHPVQIGFYDPYAYILFQVRDVFVMGDYAYLGYTYPAGLEIVDVSTPANPAKVGDFFVPGASWDVALANQFAYVANEAGLNVIDRSDPVNPVPVGNYIFGGFPLGIEVNGAYAYVAGEHDGLRIFDVSDPAQPKQIGYYPNPDSTRMVTVAGDYAYIPDTWGGVRIINVTNPYTPKLVGFIDLGVESTPSDVAVAGNYAYVTLSGRSGGFHIVDISVPRSPVILGREYDLRACLTGWWCMAAMLIWLFIAPQG